MCARIFSGYLRYRSGKFLNPRGNTYALCLTTVQVVTKKSATLPIHRIAIGLEANHRGINKYESKGDINYGKMLREVKPLVVSALAVWERYSIYVCY